jgi:hypothetical protein
LARCFAAWPQARWAHSQWTRASIATTGAAAGRAVRLDQPSAPRHQAVKDRVNALSLAPPEDFRRDSDLFADGVRSTETQRLIEAAFKRRLQTPDGELALGSMLGDLDHR